MKKEMPYVNVKEGVLIITISAEDLKQLAERKPDASYKVLDAEGFLNDFAKELENGAHHSNATETGLTSLQYLFDDFIDETYQNGSDHIIDQNDIN